MLFPRQPGRYRITSESDGSTTVTRTDLGCLGGFATGVALVFGIVAIVALFEGQWTAAGICLLLCGIFLPNFAKRRRQMRNRRETIRPVTLCRPACSVPNQRNIRDHPLNHGFDVAVLRTANVKRVFCGGCLPVGPSCSSTVRLAAAATHGLADRWVMRRGNRPILLINRWSRKKPRSMQMHEHPGAERGI